MKSEDITDEELKRRVAPLVGAWIEIVVEFLISSTCFVAPLVGAWIEIKEVAAKIELLQVAPLVGAWIEIDNAIERTDDIGSRSSCRSVD